MQREGVRYDGDLEVVSLWSICENVEEVVEVVSLWSICEDLENDDDSFDGRLVEEVTRF